MQPRVTAIVVAHNGEEHLGRTLSALAAQTRPVDQAVLVDVESGDGTAALLDAAAGSTPATQSIRTAGRTFGAGARAATRTLPPVEGTDEWIWLLAADTAPEPGALAALLGAVEVAPSVAIAGPKVVDRDDHALLLEYGGTMTALGSSVALVDRELDQAQFDRDDDVLGVGATGMLVRRHVWDALDGFDAALPSTDSGLDLSVRARLAGHRVVRVPSARVERLAPPQDFGRRRATRPSTRRRLARRAQLHRRFAYAPGAALPIHWLVLVPLAVLRSIGHLLAKRPSAVGESSPRPSRPPSRPAVSGRLAAASAVTGSWDGRRSPRCASPAWPCASAARRCASAPRRPARGRRRSCAPSSSPAAACGPCSSPRRSASACSGG